MSSEFVCTMTKSIVSSPTGTLSEETDCSSIEGNGVVPCLLLKQVIQFNLFHENAFLGVPGQRITECNKSDN